MVAELANLPERFPFLTVRASRDWPAFNCPQAHLKDLMRSLRDEGGFSLLVDVTAIDHFQTSPRFEVVYHLYALDRHAYLRIATPLEDDETPVAHSVVDLWPTADWHERETYDMFGITFAGHPDLRRILMWDGYPHFPLRKEFPLAGHEVELPAPDIVERTGIKVQPAPMMGGPFHAGQIGPMSEREPRADDESWTESQRKSDPTPEEGRPPREFRKAPRRIQ